MSVTSLGNALAAVLGAAGKIATDVLFLSRPEVAELAEPRAAGRGVSSAMPQKQNPVLSVLIRSAALQAPQLVAQLHLATANFNDERPDAAWHTEWPALRELLRLALGAAGHLRELAEGLQVYPDAMRRNLDLAGPLLLAEGVGAAVAPLLAEKDGRTGKEQLQDVVDRTLAVPAAEQGATYRRLVREAVPVGALTDLRLDELLDPASYLGQAAEISRRILAEYPDYSPPALSAQTRPQQTPTRTEPTVAKPTLKAVLLSPERALGERPLLVVGPSLGTSSAVLWGGTAALLANDYDVVAWDLPGHGVSPKATETFDVAAWLTPWWTWWTRSPPANPSTTQASPSAEPPACSWASSTANASRACPSSAPAPRSAPPKAGWTVRNWSAARALRWSSRVRRNAGSHPALWTASRT